MTTQLHLDTPLAELDRRVQLESGKRLAMEYVSADTQEDRDRIRKQLRTAEERERPEQDGQQWIAFTVHEEIVMARPDTEGITSVWLNAPRYGMTPAITL